MCKTFTLIWISTSSLPTLPLSPFFLPPVQISKASPTWSHCWVSSALFYYQAYYPSPHIHVLQYRHRYNVLLWLLYPLTIDAAHGSSAWQLNLFSPFSLLFRPAPSFHFTWFFVNAVSSGVKSVNRSWHWLWATVVGWLRQHRERDRERER